MPKIIKIGGCVLTSHTWEIFLTHSVYTIWHTAKNIKSNSQHSYQNKHS